MVERTRRIDVANVGFLPEDRKDEIIQDLVKGLQNIDRLLDGQERLERQSTLIVSQLKQFLRNIENQRQELEIQRLSIIASFKENKEIREKIEGYTEKELVVIEQEYNS